MNRACLPDNVCPPRSSKRPRTYNAIVSDYITSCRPHAQREAQWFAGQRSLDAAIKVGAMARARSGKRLNHQRRIPGAVLRGWTDHLRTLATRLRQARTFDELHEVVWREAEGFHGIGRLAAYDTAHRIGTFLKLEPERVYLHAGTRDGARLFGLGGRQSIRPSDLPRAFRRLQAAEIEDCLCIYRDDIAAIGQR